MSQGWPVRSDCSITEEALVMPNDAKLGLVVGVGLVIAVAIVFFRKDAPAPPKNALEAPPAAVNSNQPPAPPQAPAGVQGTEAVERTPPTEATPTSLRRPATPAAAERRHFIAEGDTLFTIAEKYYGQGDRFIDLYNANREILGNPDRLPVGMELRIP